MRSLQNLTAHVKLSREPMSTELDELRRLLAQEQRLRAEEQRLLAQEQRLLAQEQRLRAEEQRLLAEEQRLRAEDRERTLKTSLPTFLDGLHTHLFLGLGVQQDKTKSTCGDPVNATNKLRPRKLKAWGSFAKEQVDIWRLLMDSSLVEDRLFTSLHTLEETGESIRRQLVGSELDLHHFLRQTIEDHVSKIIEELYNDPTLRQVFGLRGSIRFENHSNTLSPERGLEEGMQNIDIRGRRRSPRLAAREQSASSNTATRDPRAPPPARSSRPRADQFCVYNIPSQSSESVHRIAAYIKEYKSPHKVKLGHIYEGLEDMDIDKVVEQEKNETLKVRFHRAIAGLLVQPYDYMIRAGTEMGVLSTGEADIYLRIGEDPGTLLYHLSVPKGDVGDYTGWDPHSSGPNRLHLTAVGQSLAFTLQALKLRPRNQAWRQQAINSLPRWKVVVADILGSIPDAEVPSSEYRPPRTNGFLRMSPIQLRRKRHNLIMDSCHSIDAQGIHRRPIQRIRQLRKDHQQKTTGATAR
ncbi:metalloprotease [Penicillium digitatum]|uniref:Metalloprotease n=1 Tax=Penicillium digitatum TaxID=36651 RepID=A0A7T7BK05_PENDI|nr:metalloprotease [Penicillium digitatum]